MKANLFEKKIEMTQKEANDAGKFNSVKWFELRNYQAMYPDFAISIKAPTKRKNGYSGLTYKYMREYIENYTGADKEELKNNFITLTGQEKSNAPFKLGNASYLSVKEWFLGQFPEIEEYKKKHDEKVQAILNTPKKKISA